MAGAWGTALSGKSWEGMWQMNISPEDTGWNPQLRPKSVHRLRPQYPMLVQSALQGRKDEDSKETWHKKAWGLRKELE